MKYCTHCGKDLADEAVVCTNCGCSPNGSKISGSSNTNQIKYCAHCGKEMVEEAVICTSCGCPTNDQNSVIFTSENEDALLKQLSERIKINGIIWLAIGVIQILLGLFVNWFILIVGVLNIVSSIQDLNYSKEILEKPTKIVEKFESVTGPIITLVYNLVIGGVIGVVGSIYYFFAIRNYVMENKEAFTTIENKAIYN